MTRTPPTAQRDDASAPLRLETVFLTGPGGLVYEMPAEVAQSYVVSMARMREIGHPPITPYGVTPQPAAMSDGNEVEGRHQVLLPSGVRGFHSDVRYGAFLWTDGHVYVGEHYHPYGTELGFTF